jgi:tRNA dimethylallyltransferase
MADREGNEALWTRLQNLDPLTAAKLNPNDRFRVVRALEVVETTGRPFAEVATRVEPPYHVIWVGLNAEVRDKLKESIKLRFDEQLEAGMLDETRRLYERYGRSQRMMSTVNYKQLVTFIEGEIDQATAEKEALQHNMQLARRQLQWFRANPLIHWLHFDTMQKTDLYKAAAKHIKERIESARDLGTSAEAT